MASTLNAHGEYTLGGERSFTALEEYGALYRTGHWLNQTRALDGFCKEWPELSMDITLHLLAGFLPYYNAGGSARFTY